MGHTFKPERLPVCDATARRGIAFIFLKGLNYLNLPKFT
jgi:hypothetical protein